MYLIHCVVVMLESKSQVSGMYHIHCVVIMLENRSLVCT